MHCCPNYQKIYAKERREGGAGVCYELRVDLAGWAFLAGGTRNSKLGTSSVDLHLKRLQKASKVDLRTIEGCRVDSVI